MKTYPSYACASGALIGDMDSIKFRVETIEYYLKDYDVKDDISKEYRMGKIMRAIEIIKQITEGADFKVDHSETFLKAYEEEMKEREKEHDRFMAAFLTSDEREMIERDNIEQELLQDTL